MEDTKETLRQFILQQYLPGESAGNLRDDTPLRTSGILDSLATLALVNFVEERYGVQLEAHETGIEYFDRIQDIAQLIERKRRPGAQ